MTSLDGVQTITVGVLAFFVLIALITIVRIILNREASAWRGLRVGFFVERDHAPEQDPPKEGARDQEADG